jgi:hypothetical protein
MARYRDAIRWIAENDDTDWIENEHGIPSVTACLVADLFEKTEEAVTEDIKKALRKLVTPENHSRHSNP